MSAEKTEAYYQAGIAILAVKAGIQVVQLSLDRDHEVPGVVLEPVRAWCSLNAGMNDYKIMQIEEYVTACLGGAAARFVMEEAELCSIAKSMGTAGIEMAHLRRIFDCVDREVDRAFAIAFGSLSQVDDGDTQATLYRLWHRAVEKLRELPNTQNVKRLAKKLLASRRMSGDQVRRILKAY